MHKFFLSRTDNVGSLKGLRGKNVVLRGDHKVVGGGYTDKCSEFEYHKAPGVRPPSGHNSRPSVYED
jgi:hypothetical protein